MNVDVGRAASKDTVILSEVRRTPNESKDPTPDRSPSNPLRIISTCPFATPAPRRLPN
jgi:hypothetical protein